MLSLTAQRAVAAYGGEKLWKKAETIEAVVSAHGLAFTLKRRPIFKHARMQMQVHKPAARFTPIGKDPKITGVWSGRDVHLEDGAGNVIAARSNARSYFPFGRRLFYWDDLDMTYFANYATWNYLTLPALLLNPDIGWTEKEPGLLEGVFPETIPSHSRVQTFRFDLNTGRLLQHNYTADVISRLANAANVVHGHSDSNGIAFTSRRIVTPQKPSGRPMGGPVLIDLTIHEFSMT